MTVSRIKSALLPALAVALLGAGALCGCRTNEENYRRAYEAAAQAKARNADLDSTIYGNVRRLTSTATATLPGDGRQVEVTSERVTLTPDVNPADAEIRPYSLVAGRFKQLFHAKSMRSRLAEAGWSEAMIVQTAEPLYYVVAFASDDLRQVADAADSLRLAPPFPLGADMPFILRAATSPRRR